MLSIRRQTLGVQGGRSDRAMAPESKTLELLSQKQPSTQTSIIEFFSDSPGQGHLSIKAASV